MILKDFSLELVRNTTLVKGGVMLNNATYIKYCIDGVDMEAEDDFEDALIYWPELKRSLDGNGKYLVFTCACGVADCGGWWGVLVNYGPGVVTWEIPELQISWTFDAARYSREIQAMEIAIVAAGDISLEPCFVEFPENW